MKLYQIEELEDNIIRKAVYEYICKGSDFRHMVSYQDLQGEKILDIVIGIATPEINFLLSCLELANLYIELSDNRQRYSDNEKLDDKIIQLRRQVVDYTVANLDKNKLKKYFLGKFFDESGKLWTKEN